MNRKEFLISSTVFTANFFIARDLLAKPRGPVVGHNDHRYKLDTSWGTLNANKYPVNDCHEMVQDKSGRILLLTNETRNNILVYNKSGRLLKAWGHEFPGAHGLTLFNANGEEFLFITDTQKHQVYKVSMSGRILMTMNAPIEAGIYKKTEEFIPTETAIAANGDIFIADGYGAQYVLHYNSGGKLLGYFGGKGTEDINLANVHGVCVDNRYSKPTLLVTDRTKNCFKRFSMDGKLQEIINLPGACVCRPVIKGDYLYAAVLRSPSMKVKESGFVTILNKANKVISNLGGSEPQYNSQGELQPLSQTEKIFIHPHDVCVDDDENLYVAQWASGKVYPFKLSRV